MRCVTGALMFLALGAAVAPAQQDDGQLVFRDFSAVRRMRVVCSSEHFGRVEDLVAEVPSGRITAAVVAVNFVDGVRRVGVPFAEMTYDPRSNVFDLGDCRLEDDAHPTFDATKVAVVRKVSGGEVGDDLEGSVLVSRLAAGRVDLADGKASAQGLTLELHTGHLAFVDLAIDLERAGDRDLHPVPWSAFACKADARSVDRVALALTLIRDKAFVLDSPTLIEIIVRDPLRRARVYSWFQVPHPGFETGND